MAYVYCHYKSGTNEIFYIGIGSDNKFKRAHSVNGRNKLWHKIAAKHGFETDILSTDLSWEEACSKEIDYISKYGRIDLKNGILCNMTSGGDGKANNVCSAETRELMSKSKKGNKLTDYVKHKIALSKQKKIVNLQTGIFYDSAKEAAYYNGINLNTLYSNLSKSRNNKTDFIYI